MSGFSVTTNGTTVSAKMAAGSTGASLVVLVDGKVHANVTVAAGASTQAYTLVSTQAYTLASTQAYTLASQLSPGTHRVAAFKVTEDLELSSVSLAAGGGSELHLHEVTSDGTLQRPAAQGGRKLEFIGDSDTAGWCSLGKPLGGDGALKHEDAYVTWAQQLARGVNASETSTVAVSGWGVTTDSAPIQKVYRNTYGQGSSVPRWDFSTWVPDAVVMLIGPNDESLLRRIGERDGAAVVEAAEEGAAAGAVAGDGSGSFVKAYLALMTEVASAYADAPTPPKLVHVCGGSINGLDPCDDIQTANQRFNDDPPKGFKGYYTTISKKSWQMINKAGSKYKGCDAHYSPLGHKVLADAIRPQLEAIMGW